MFGDNGSKHLIKKDGSLFAQASLITQVTKASRLYVREVWPFKLFVCNTLGQTYVIKVVGLFCFRLRSSKNKIFYCKQDVHFDQTIEVFVFLFALI